ncbi:MAG TPA: S-layer homology domain-containing protein [Candidatus Peribacterales bacterium]|nr:S-layer homology domain-containing protein [Candidatus Peribacterales bacterium]
MHLRFSVAIIGLAVPTLAFASAFPDVPSSHPHADAIYDLQRRGFVRGSDDGMYYPDRELNRAEGLTLLLRAAEIEVRDVYKGCFSDSKETWYEATVCQAVHDSIVSGYPDGMFHGDRIINAVEFLKILLNALGFTIPDLSLGDQVGIDFKNVNVKSWYAKYLFRAMEFNLIPAELIANNDFRPDGPVNRSQAAEMIYRALGIAVAERSDIRGTASSESSITPTGATLVDFPVHQTGKTGERGASAFAFDLKAPQTILVEAANITSTSTGVSCFLYLLGESGFSSEFFIGYQEGGSCYIRAALRAGRYQVEVRTKSEGADYSLDAVAANGDGNDGFTEAVLLPVSSPKNAQLIAQDYEDWFRFRVDTKEAHRVMLITSSDLACSIYPSEDVDLFGFEGPVCGESYDYPPGTYYVSVKKKKEAAGTQTYSVELR